LGVLIVVSLLVLGPTMKTTTAVAFARRLVLAPVPLIQIRLEIVGANQIFHVQERCTFHSDIDKRGLHSGQDARYSTENDVAYAPAMLRPLQVKFGNDAVFDETHACLSKIAIDDQRISRHVFRRGLGVVSSPQNATAALLNLSICRSGEAPPHGGVAKTRLDAENRFTSTVGK
jgi:hypothetical protein